MLKNGELTCAVIANLSSNSYFNLERRCGLEHALGKFFKSVKFVSLYDNVDWRGNLKNLNYLNEILADIDILFLHKEFLLHAPLDFWINLSFKPNLYIVGFVGDEEWALSYTINFLPFFDASVVYSKKAQDFYLEKKFNVFHLPIGASFSKVSNLARSQIEDIDVLFIGRPYKPRPEIIKYLLKKNISVKVFGEKKWRRYLSKKNYLGFVSNENYNNELSRAKVILALMESPSSSAIPHMNSKIFDAAKVEKFAIATQFDSLYQEYGLIEGESIVTYQNLDQLCEKILYYLKNNSLRKQIAAGLRQKLISDFDYEKNYYRVLQEIFFAGGCKSIPKVTYSPLEFNGWKCAAQGCKKIQYSPILCKILELNSGSGLPIVLCSSMGRSIIRKKFPIVDAASVFYPDNINRPFTLMGFCLLINRVELPEIPLNIYTRSTIQINLMKIIDAICYLCLRLINSKNKV